MTKSIADALRKPISEFKRPPCDFCSMPAEVPCAEQSCGRRMCKKHGFMRDGDVRDEPPMYCADHREAAAAPIAAVEPKNEKFNPTELSPVPKQLVPKCPHCGTQPARVNQAQTTFQSGLIAMVFFCSNCEKIHTIVPIGQAAPQIMPARSLPGRPS